MTETPSPTLNAGGNTFAFRWRDGRLEYMDPDRGPVLTGENADVEVSVNVFQADSERLVCGQVTVTTVLTGDDFNRQRQRFNTLGEAVDPIHIDSALWRAIPIGQLIEGTYEGIRALAARMFNEIGEQRLGEIASSSTPGKRPGPKPSLTPELLARVVRPAFLAGGRRPVEAVRAALQEADYPGSGPDGGVTIDQARKAVKKARQLELLPPARQGGSSR